MGLLTEQWKKCLSQPGEVREGFPGCHVCLSMIKSLRGRPDLAERSSHTKGRYQDSRRNRKRENDNDHPNSLLLSTYYLCQALHFIYL